MISTRVETIAVEGGEMNAHLAVPAEGTGSGILLIQEIGGVNSYMRDVAERLAALGYVTLVPDLFWRVQPNFFIDTFTEATLGQAMDLVAKVDEEKVLADLGSALEHLRELPEMIGGTGVVGFCFGGTFTFLMAAEYEPDVAVAYYGSGIASAVERAVDIHCPMLMHFGDQDPYLPADDIEAITQATNTLENIEILVQPGAGHAFDNHVSEMFHQPDAAAAAWTRTVGFLAEHLPDF